MAIYSVTGTANDEHYRARDVLLETKMEGVGKVKMPGLSPKSPRRPVRSGGSADHPECTMRNRPGSLNGSLKKG